jgi:hypothetical protein
VSVVVRLDRELRPCAGFTLPADFGAIWSVTGLSDGSELLGVEGRLVHVSGESVLWSRDAGTTDDYPLSSVPIAVGGRPLVAILWGHRSYDRADRLELVELASGALVREYDVTHSAKAVGAPGSGLPDRLSLAYDYNRVREYLVDLSADALGGVDELEILGPQSGVSLTGLDARPMHVGVSSVTGLLRWTKGRSPSLVGPVGCRFPRYAGVAIPESCGSFESTSLDPDDPDRQVAVCDEPAGGGFDESMALLLHVGPRGDCELLLDSRHVGEVEITSADWAGI